MIIGLLTGRGGRKTQSLPFKNTKKVLGKPLMLYPYLAAKKSKFIDDIYISTDGDEIKEIAKKNDIKIINRPKSLAQDNSQHIDCINHSLKFFKSKNINVNILVILMCNVAIQPLGSIDRCIKALIDDESIDCAVTCKEWGDHHPSRAKTFNKKGFLKPISKNIKLTTTRQDLDETYYLDHQVWAFRIRKMSLPKSGQYPWYWMGKKIKPIINDDIVIDIHNEMDIKYSELWLKNNSRLKNKNNDI